MNPPVPILGHAAFHHYSTPFYENIPRDGYSAPRPKRTKILKKKVVMKRGKRK